MATVVVCDGCGTPCPDGGTTLGTLRPVTYCPACAETWRAYGGHIADAQAAAVATFEGIRRDLMTLARAHLKVLPDA